MTCKDGTGANSMEKNWRDHMSSRRTKPDWYFFQGKTIAGDMKNKNNESAYFF